MSHSFSGQFGGRFQGPHSTRDRHEGQMRSEIQTDINKTSLLVSVETHQLPLMLNVCFFCLFVCLFSCFQVAMNVYELSSAAGLPCEIDPALVVALSSQKSGEI